MTKEDLVRAVRALATPVAPLVTSRQVKDHLTALGVDWGEPHGWPIRNAEDDELASTVPRIVKWKRGASDNSMIGYTLRGAAPAGKAAGPWRRIAP